MEYTLTSSSAEQTKLLGERFGKLLQGGDVICLLGDLGAGKTSFAQGVGVALDVDGYMTSPTFTLIQEYAGLAQGEEIQLVHMDLYRLQNFQEAEVIGVEDFFQKDKICLIEWPERALELMPEDRLELEIRGSGEEERQLIFCSYADSWLKRLEEFGAKKR